MENIKISKEEKDKLIKQANAHYRKAVKAAETEYLRIANPAWDIYDKSLKAAEEEFHKRIAEIDKM
jgi:hypothetical protein